MRVRPYLRKCLTKSNKLFSKHSCLLENKCNKFLLGWCIFDRITQKNCDFTFRQPYVYGGDARILHFSLFIVNVLLFSCTETDFIFNSSILNRSLHAVEIGWSYLAPALLAAVMDARVFLTHSPRIVLISEAATQENSVNKQSSRIIGII